MTAATALLSPEHFIISVQSCLYVQTSALGGNPLKTAPPTAKKFPTPPLRWVHLPPREFWLPTPVCCSSVSTNGANFFVLKGDDGEGTGAVQ